MRKYERIESSKVRSVISSSGVNTNWGVTMDYVVVGRDIDKDDIN